MSNPLTRLARRVGRSYALVVALGVVVGLIAAPIAYSAATSTDGTVAVVPIEGTIDGQSAAAVTAALREAREDPSVEAVVIVSNSGGGGAAASETMYFGTKRTAEEMPVVASVDASAASGAYYAITPADAIYAKPASVVGSVGVLATLPQNLEPNDIVGTTGPDKLTGGDVREFLYVMESLHRAFVGAVLSQRGEALELTRAELEQARVYSGAQAVRVGLADDIGDREAAIREAARRAGLSDYDVQVIRPQNGSVSFLSRSSYLASDAPDRRLVGAERLVGNDTGGPTFLMVAPMYVDPADIGAVEARQVSQAAVNGSASTGGENGTTTSSSDAISGPAAPISLPADLPEVERAVG